MAKCINKTAISVTLNGQQTNIATAPDSPLLYALREVLALKGTRFGCGEAVCGACTVIADGVAITSCDQPVSAFAGKTIETVESLDTDPPHPLVTAMIDLQAIQCGYCLPGILMSAKALLDKVEKPDREAIIAALDDNLCRCGAHSRILRAVERAAGLMAEDRK